MNFTLSVAAAILVAGVAFYLYRKLPPKDPSHFAPRKISISLGQTVRDFIQTNNLTIEKGRTETSDTNNYAIAVDVIADTSPIIFGDHWIQPQVQVGTQHFELPSCRTLFIDQVAGRIYSFTFTPFEKAHPLDETNRLVKQLIDSFLKKGWTLKMAAGPSFTPTNEDKSFKAQDEKIYAKLNDRDGNLITVTSADLASVPAQESYILAPTGRRPVHDPPVYVISLGFYWSRRNELSYGDLIYPRRIFVNGNKNQGLRLRAWVEDPDWIPEKHGMKLLGGQGEQKIWSLTGK